MHHLGRAELLDAHGGSDVVQVAPAALSFDQGVDQIVGVRLSPKGLFRWYASCCKTPLGNTLGTAVPFVGITVQTFAVPRAEVDEIFGASLGSVRGEFAIGEPPPGSTTPPFRVIARALRRILSWRLRGQTWPHPFFDRATKAPTHSVTVLSRSEREALRPLCGPHPTA